MDKKTKVLFIIGSGHCGSTLLELMLDSHPNITAIGEPQEIDRENYPDWGECMELIKTPVELCRSKFNTVLGINRFNFYKTKEGVDEFKYIEWNKHLFECLSDKSNSDVIVDSSKNIERVEMLSKGKEIEPIVLHIVRDGRGVTWSYLRKYPQNKLFALSIWFFSNIKIELFKLRVKTKVKTITYEALVKNPQREITRVLSFVGEEFHPDVLKFYEKEHRYRIGGNRMSKNPVKEIKEDTTWKSEMPFKYKVLFNLFFGWLNLYYYIRY